MAEAVLTRMPGSAGLISSSPSLAMINDSMSVPVTNCWLSRLTEATPLPLMRSGLVAPVVCLTPPSVVSDATGMVGLATNSPSSLRLRALPPVAETLASAPIL